MMIAWLICCMDASPGSGWVGQSAAIIVPIISLCAGVIIAKLNSNLEIEKALCIRKVDVFEKAVLQVNRLINLYAAEIASINHAWDMATLEGELATLISNVNQSSQALKFDDDRLRITFYLKLPQNNACPIIQATARFLQELQDIIKHVQTGSSIHESQLRKFNDVREWYFPLLVKEYEYLVSVNQVVINAIQHDRQLHKLVMHQE